MSHTQKSETSQSAPFDLSSFELPDLPKNKQPIYKLSIKYGDVDAYYRSKHLNAECGQAIDQAITDSNYELFHYDLKTAARTVIAEYGAERVAWVLAENIQFGQLDGRISSANIAWAMGFLIPEKPNVYLNCHRTLLNGFVDSFREVEKEKPSLTAALATGKQKSRDQSGSKLEPSADTQSKAQKPHR